MEYDISVPSVSHKISLGLEAMIIDFNKLGLFDSNIDYDDLPEQAFRFVGSIEEAITKAKTLNV